AYKQIFPALQAMVKSGVLKVPVVGVARSSWNLDQLRARARDSLQHHGGVDRGAFDKLSSLLHYVDGDYNDPKIFDRLRKEPGARHPPPPRRRARSAPPSAASAAGAAAPMHASPSRSRSAATAPRRASSTRRCTRSSPRNRSSASITSSARSRCRTSSSSASA